jgi:hypothetical protein
MLISVFATDCAYERDVLLFVEILGSYTFLMMLTRLKSSSRPIVLEREIFEEKDDLKRMEAKRLLSLPEGFEVTTMDMTDGILTIDVVSTQISACCPLCSSAATRLHSSPLQTCRVQGSRCVCGCMYAGSFVP